MAPVAPGSCASTLLCSPGVGWILPAALPAAEWVLRLLATLN